MEQAEKQAEENVVTYASITANMDNKTAESPVDNVNLKNCYQTSTAG